MGMIIEKGLSKHRFIKVFGNYGHEELLRADLVRHVWLRLPDEEEVVIEFDRYGDIASYTEVYKTRGEAMNRFDELRYSLDAEGKHFPLKDCDFWEHVEKDAYEAGKVAETLASLGEDE